MFPSHTERVIRERSARSPKKLQWTTREHTSELQTHTRKKYSQIQDKQYERMDMHMLHKDGRSRVKRRERVESDMRPVDTSVES